MKFLVVVDMQNDFITGPLGTPEARAIVPTVKAKIEQAIEEGKKVIFTRDSHTEHTYLASLEGEKLPVPHCFYNTFGWEIISELKDIPTLGYLSAIDKNTFGSFDLPEVIWSRAADDFEAPGEIELCGVCTDICVISNAAILRAALPNVPIKVDAKACAGVTPEKHKAALEVMKSIQIDVEE